MSSHVGHGEKDGQKRNDLINEVIIQIAKTYS